MKKILINIHISLFIIYFSLYSIISVAEESNLNDKELKKTAEFSCLSYAAARLGNIASLRITQVNPPLANSNDHTWVVVGNKIVNDDEGSIPMSFSCKLIANESPLWDLEDLSIYKVPKDTVEKLKNLKTPSN